LTHKVSFQLEEIANLSAQDYPKQIEQLRLELEDKHNELEQYAQALQDMEPPEEQ
jgi:hypothetical protein